MNLRTKWICSIMALSLFVACGLFVTSLVEAADTAPAVSAPAVSAPAAADDAAANAALARKIASSINNLKQMGLVCKMFMNESRGQASPRLSKTAGCLMVDKEAVYPEYLTDCNILVSPVNPDGKSLMNSARVDSNSYLYLGYLVEKPEDVDLFLKMYEAGVLAKSSFEQDLKDTASGKTIYRLKEGIERLIVQDKTDPAAFAKAQSEIPLMFERRAFYKDGKAPVLFFDGHVERLGPGQNKVVDRIFELLPKFEALGKQ